MDANELKTVLEKHALWLADEEGGERANLSWADLRGANLSWADLRGANLDFSCWPLLCGSKCVKVDARITAQLAAHFCVLDCDDPAYQAARAAVLEFAKTSHRAKDLGLLEESKP